MPKEQKINVNQEDVTRNGHTVSVLSINKTELGYIEQQDDRFLAYQAGETEPNRFKTMDDAVNFLIAEFHLHHS